MVEVIASNVALISFKFASKILKGLYHIIIPVVYNVEPLVIIFTYYLITI